MMTLRGFSCRRESIPISSAWYLADLGHAKGKQEVFTRQSPQKLKLLREHAMIESAISSNRIEGVVVDPTRVGTIVVAILKQAFEGKLVPQDPGDEPASALLERIRAGRAPGGNATRRFESGPRASRQKRLGKPA